MQQPAIRFLIVPIIIHSIEFKQQLRALRTGGHIGNGSTENHLRTYTESSTEICLGNLTTLIGGIDIEEMTVLSAIRISVGTVVELGSRPPQVVIFTRGSTTRPSTHICRLIESVFSMQR